MKTNVITQVNQVEIIAVTDGARLVPIKPICEALGIDYPTQWQKLKDDEDLSSVVGLSPITARDGKEYEMACLPLEFVFGWLFSINPKNVKPEAQEAVRRYRMQCYRALYEYFSEPQTFLKQKQEVIEQKVSEYQDCQRRFRDAQKLMTEAKTELNQVMKITIEEWRDNNRQLLLSFPDEVS